jgi:hypothetical protein
MGLNWQLKYGIELLLEIHKHCLILEVLEILEQKVLELFMN